MELLRAIAKKFGSTRDEAAVNLALVGVGCAAFVAIPILILLLWFVLWVAGLILKLVF